MTFNRKSKLWYSPLRPTIQEARANAGHWIQHPVPLRHDRVKELRGQGYEVRATKYPATLDNGALLYNISVRYPATSDPTGFENSTVAEIRLEIVRLTKEINRRLDLSYAEQRRMGIAEHRAQLEILTHNKRSLDSLLYIKTQE